jgi:putative ABC transport system permease protein
MVLRKRIKRIIGENKGRYTGIFILIFLGSFAFVMMSGLGDNMANMLGSFAEQNMQEDIMFGTDERLENLPALERQSGAVIDYHRYTDIVLPAGELRLMTPSSRVNIPAILSGRGLQNPGEILLDPIIIQFLGLDIGGQINVGGRGFSIVGTAATPNYVYILRFVHDIMPDSSFGIGIISDADMEAFPESVLVYTARFTDRDDISGQLIRLRNLVSEERAITEWAMAGINNRIQTPWASITGMQTVSAPMVIIMLLLCCLIVGLMISRMVKSDAVVIGTLYALGYRRKELIRHYMAIPLIWSVVAGLAGVLLALPTVGPTVGMMTEFYNFPVTGMSVSVLNVILGVLLPVAFMGLSGFFVIRKILKHKAVELMRGDWKKSKVNIIERNLKLERFKFSTKFGLREQIRSIPRLLFLLFGVSIAAMLIMFGFTLNNSFNAIMGSAAGEMFDFDLEYSFRTVQTGEVPEGAEPFNAMRSAPEGRDGIDFYTMAVATDIVGMTLRDARGERLPMNQVNITSPLAGRLNIGVGDAVRIVDQLDGRAYSLIIGGIVDTPSMQFIFMPLDDFNLMTGHAPGSFSGLLSNRELDFDPRILSGVSNLRMEDMGDFGAIMTMMVAFFIALSVLIGAVIIFLITSMMIEESRVTISMLKVFGYRRKEAAKLILNSSTPVVFIGFCLGIPMMLVTGNFLFGYIVEMVNMVLPMIINPLNILVSFVIIFAMYWLTKRLCARKLAKIPMSEALKAATE